MWGKCNHREVRCVGKSSSERERGEVYGEVAERDR